MKLIRFLKEPLGFIVICFILNAETISERNFYSILDVELKVEDTQLSLENSSTSFGNNSLLSNSK